MIKQELFNLVLCLLLIFFFRSFSSSALVAVSCNPPHVSFSHFFLRSCPNSFSNSSIFFLKPSRVDLLVLSAAASLFSFCAFLFFFLQGNFHSCNCVFWRCRCPYRKCTVQIWKVTSTCRAVTHIMTQLL